MDGISMIDLLRRRGHLFNEHAVIAGNNGIDRIATKVHVIEEWDLYDQAIEGDFLLTTSTAFMKAFAKEGALMSVIAANKVTAIGMLMDNRPLNIPPQILSQADEYRIPIIELAGDIHFPYVTFEVLDEILNQKAKMIDLVHNQLQNLTSLVLMGESTLTFLQEVSAYLNCEVGLMLDNGRNLGSIPECNFVWPLNMEVLGKPVEHTYHGVNLYQTVDRELVRLWMPIERDEQAFGYLVCSTNEIVISTADIMILQHASQLLVLILSKQRGLINIEEKYKEEFLQKWILGEWKDKETLLLQAISASLSLAEHYVLCSFSDMGKLSSEEFLQLRTFLTRKGFLLATLGQQLLFLIPSRSKTGIRETEWTELYDSIRKILKRKPFNLGISSVKSLEKVYLAYQEVKDALVINLSLRLEQSLIFYEKLGIYPILYSIAEESDLPSKMLKILEPLMGEPIKQAPELLETLRCYFQQNRNIKETAAALFCHYNSVVYRMERIENVLNISFRNSEDIFQLDLGIRVYDFMKKSHPQKLTEMYKKPSP